MAKKKEPKIKMPKITILASGQAHTRVMINGVSTSITKDTPEEAFAEYVALKYKAKEVAERKQKKQVTLKDALDAYIENRKGKVSPATIKGYMSYRDNRLQNMMDANVYETTNKQWKDAVEKDFKKLSNKYARNVWSFFASAIEEETGKRPKVETDPPKKKKHPFLEPEEILIFVDAIRGRSIEIAALLELSSLRVSEVMSVRGTDVDLKHNRVRVEGAAVYGPDGKLTQKDDNKNESSTRYVPIIPPLRQALEGKELTDDFLVKMRPGSIYKHINRVCASNGMPAVGNHGLRHSFASLAYHLGIPEKVAMEIGGWSDSKTMHEIYTHLAKRDIAKRSQQFSDFFLKKETELE